MASYGKAVRRACARVYQRLFLLGRLGLTVALLLGFSGIILEALSPGISPGLGEPALLTLYAAFVMTSTWGISSKISVKMATGRGIIMWILFGGFFLMMAILTLTLECVPEAPVSGFCAPYPILNGYTGMAVAIVGLVIGHTGSVISITRRKRREQEDEDLVQEYISRTSSRR